MATLSKRPGGRDRAGYGRGTLYKGKTFERKTDARRSATEMEAAVSSGSSADVIATPTRMTRAQRIKAYTASVPAGRTTTANLI